MSNTWCRQPTRIAVAVVEQQGMFLVGRRPAGTPLAGLWEFPGGKIRAGETPREAAVRECLEEAGLETVVCSEFPVEQHQYEHAWVELHFFACQLRDARQSVPLAPFCWVPRRDLMRYEFPAANQRLLELLRA